MFGGIFSISIACIKVNLQMDFQIPYTTTFTAQKEIILLLNSGDKNQSVMDNFVFWREREFRFISTYPSPTINLRCKTMPKSKQKKKKSVPKSKESPSTQKEKVKTSFFANATPLKSPMRVYSKKGTNSYF